NNKQNKKRRNCKNEHGPDPFKGVGDKLKKGQVEIDLVVQALEVAQVGVAEIVQKWHQIAALVCQGILVQPFSIVQGRVVIKMVIDKGKIETLNVSILPKYG